MQTSSFIFAEMHNGWMHI